MGNLAFVICSKESYEPMHRIKAVDYILRLVNSLFRKTSVEDCVQGIQISDEMEFYIIKLPFSFEEYKSLEYKNSENIKSLIARAVAQYNIEFCLLPERMSSVGELEGCVRNPFEGSTLYQSLLMSILNEIYTNRGVKISSLDIGVIIDENVDKDSLNQIFELLTPLVRYITVITKHKAGIDDLVETVYEDTGLSIGVTSDFASGFKNSDLIINLGQIDENIIGVKPGGGAIVLNYGKIDTKSSLLDNTIINGIDITLPKSIAEKLDSSIYTYFKRIEISEAFLSQKYNYSNKTGSCKKFNYIDELNKDFTQSNFRISGFLGRRNILKASDISLPNILYNNFMDKKVKYKTK